ncbi:MAG TPA: hypothetical protein VGM56_19685 [Byssovorax sp.]
MIRDVVLAFDAWVGAGEYQRSSDKVALRLGRYEMLAGQATFDTFGGAGDAVVGIALFHSANGHDWIDAAMGTSGVISTDGSTPNTLYFYSASPILPFVQVRVTSSIAAHARIYAVLRDPSD